VFFVLLDQEPAYYVEVRVAEELDWILPLVNLDSTLWTMGASPSPVTSFEITGEVHFSPGAMYLAR
jgi:hypothetical protein